MTLTASSGNARDLDTLPGDDARQILWGFAGRDDLQILVQSVRAVARGPVARLVAQVARNTHEWTAEKQELLRAYDKAGITSFFMEPGLGGFIEGPKNLALALVTFELAWVDAGAATSSLTGYLALWPILERGAPEQRDLYCARCTLPLCGEDRFPWRGSSCLTELSRFASPKNAPLGGKVRVAEWRVGQEPLLHVETRGHFATNMACANFVSAAVESADPRIEGKLMIVLEESDPGTFDRGVPARRFVNHLFSASDPIFSLWVPASRIIGGYEVRNRVIVPHFSHGEILEAVDQRSCVAAGIMASARLLSAVEPVIRYQRERFRGGSPAGSGTPRYDFGLQMKEDAVHRLLEVWAGGESCASLSFQAARLLDRLDPLQRLRDLALKEYGIVSYSARLEALRQTSKDAVAHLLGERPDLAGDLKVETAMLESVVNVLCPACRMWSIRRGSRLMREAVSLMGGCGVTEDCPGFVGYKWIDSEMEAINESPQGVQQRQLDVTMTDELFLIQFRVWISELQAVAATHPIIIGPGALAIAMEVWLWTFKHRQHLNLSSQGGVTLELADALCGILASRAQILDVIEFVQKSPSQATLAEGSQTLVKVLADLCHLQAANLAGEMARVCAELVHGYDDISARLAFTDMQVLLDGSLA